MNTVVAPVAETAQRYRLPLSPEVRPLRDNVVDVAPLMLTHVDPASVLICHWYESDAPPDTVAATEKYTDPAEIDAFAIVEAEETKAVPPPPAT